MVVVGCTDVDLSRRLLRFGLQGNTYILYLLYKSRYISELQLILFSMDITIWLNWLAAGSPGPMSQ